MSELKAYKMVNELYCTDRPSVIPAEVYFKSEADKVIAEKDKEIAELKDKCQMHDFFWDGCGFDKLGFKNSIAVREAFDRLEAENEKLRGESCKLTDGCLRLKQCRKEKAHLADKLRHSNHKRCLAMADMNWLQANRYSAAEMVERIRGNFEESTQCSKLEKKYLKRYNKWLALAEEPTWAKFLQLIHKEAK